ncbi:MAG: hypothetical protein IPM99_20025 [Rubrivivax sp.]|nr:hypothetical protein [Rubrivivax sp.]
MHDPKVTRVDFAEADHTFSVPGTAARMDEATAGWLQRAIIDGYLLGKA